MKKQKIYVLSGTREEVESSIAHHAENNMVAFRGVTAVGSNIVVLIELTKKDFNYDPYTGEYLSKKETEERINRGRM